jgi:hypothetical protein
LNRASLAAEDCAGPRAGAVTAGDAALAEVPGRRPVESGSESVPEAKHPSELGGDNPGGSKVGEGDLDRELAAVRSVSATLRASSNLRLVSDVGKRAWLRNVSTLTSRPAGSEGGAGKLDAAAPATGTAGAAGAAGADGAPLPTGTKGAAGAADAAQATGTDGAAGLESL